MSQAENLDQHVDSLLRKLAPVAEAIRTLAADDCEVTFSCVIYANVTPAPALYFERKWISEIAALGAALDIDLYLSAEPDS